MSLPIRLSEKATPLESSGITVVMEVNSSLPVKSDFHTLHVSLRRYFKLQRGKLIIKPSQTNVPRTQTTMMCALFKLVGGGNHQVSCPVMGKKIIRKWTVTLLPGPSASRIACCLGQSTPPRMAPHGTNLKLEAFHDGACADPLSFHFDMGRQVLLNGLFALLDIFATL